MQVRAAESTVTLSVDVHRRHCHAVLERLIHQVEQDPQLYTTNFAAWEHLQPLINSGTLRAPNPDDEINPITASHVFKVQFMISYSVEQINGVQFLTFDSMYGDLSDLAGVWVLCAWGFDLGHGERSFLVDGHTGEQGQYDNWPGNVFACHSFQALLEWPNSRP